MPVLSAGQLEGTGCLARHLGLPRAQPPSPLSHRSRSFSVQRCFGSSASMPRSGSIKRQRDARGADQRRIGATLDLRLEHRLVVELPHRVASHEQQQDGDSQSVQVVGGRPDTPARRLGRRPLGRQQQRRLAERRDGGHAFAQHDAAGALVAQEDVGRTDVAMNDTAARQLPQGGRQRLDHRAGDLLLRHLLAGVVQAVHEPAPAGIFQDEDDPLHAVDRPVDHAPLDHAHQRHMLDPADARQQVHARRHAQGADAGEDFHLAVAQGPYGIGRPTRSVQRRQRGSRQDLVAARQIDRLVTAAGRCCGWSGCRHRYGAVPA